MNKRPAACRTRSAPLTTRSRSSAAELDACPERMYDPERQRSRIGLLDDSLGIEKVHG